MKSPAEYEGLKKQPFSLTTSGSSNISFPDVGADKVVVGVMFTSSTNMGILFYGTASGLWSCHVKNSRFEDVPNTNVSGYCYYYDA